MNLTLALFLAQNIGSMESTEWATAIITKINNKYIRERGDLLVYHHFVETPEDWLMERLLENLYGRMDFTVSVLNGTQDKEPPDFVRPQGILLFIEFSKMTYAGIVTDVIMNMLKALHTGLRVVVVLTHHKFVRDRVVLFLLEKFWSINVRNVIVVNAVVEETSPAGVKIFYWRPDFLFNKHSGIRVDNIHKITLLMKDDMKTIHAAMKSDELFELIDLTDIRGHFLNVSVAVTPPYVWLNVVKWANILGVQNEPLTTDKLDGIEISILRAFRDKYNLTGFFIVHPSEIADIHLDDDPSEGYSVLEETALGLSDIAIGGNVASPELYQFFGPSTVYFEDVMRWYVPGAQTIPVWRNLYLIFDGTIWTGIAIAHVLASVATFVMIRCAPRGNNRIDFSVAALVVWATELSQPVNLPIRDRVKLLFLSCLLYGMHISNFYQSGLITVLHEQYYESPIRTVAEARAAGMKVCIPGISYEFFVGQNVSADGGGSNYTYSVEMDFIECLDQVAETKRTITLVPEKATEYTIPMRYLDNHYIEMIQKMPKRLISYPVSMYLTKASPYRKPLNFVIESLLESGIIQKWWKDIRFAKSKVKRPAKKLNPHEYSSISLRNATGVFSIFLLSCGISLLIFILEIVWHGVSKWRRRRMARREAKAKAMADLVSRVALRPRVSAFPYSD